MKSTNLTANKKPFMSLGGSQTKSSPTWGGEGTAFACDYVNDEAIVRRLPSLTEFEPPLKRLKEVDWTFASLFQEILSSKSCKVLDFPSLQALRDADGRMFVFTKPGHARHPAVSALVWQGRIPREPDTHDFIQKIVEDRWIEPAEEDPENLEKYFSNLAERHESGE